MNKLNFSAAAKTLLHVNNMSIQFVVLSTISMKLSHWNKNSPHTFLLLSKLKTTYIVSKHRQQTDLARTAVSKSFGEDYKYFFSTHWFLSSLYLCVLFSFFSFLFPFLVWTSTLCNVVAK